MKKFRFGARFDRAASRKDWLDKVRAVEDLGYTSIFFSDHFFDLLAPWPPLIVAAEHSGLRIGTLVLDNDFRHPTVLAREASTIDLLTEGRLELGIGAGWLKPDYDWSGIPFDPPATRVERLEEAVQVLKGCFGAEAFSFTGKHYTVTDLNGLPKPVQQPLPVILGGGGRRVLQLAGRHAEIVSVFYNLRQGRLGEGSDGTAEAAARKIGWVRDAAGERFEDIELLLHVFPVIVTDDRLAAADQLGQTMGLEAKDVLEVPFVLVGTHEQMCDDLRRRREELGFSYVVAPDEAFRDLGPVVSMLRGK